MQQRPIPGMQQLTAWLSRPATTPAPPEVRLMVRGVGEGGLNRIVGLAVQISGLPYEDVYARVESLWREVTGMRAAEQPTEAPRAADTLPPEQASALLWYVFDRYWYHVAQREPGKPIADDDVRAIQAIRLMGWKTPEERNPPVITVPGPT